LAPDPPKTTQSGFNVISLNDLKAHHRGAGPKFTVDSIIQGIYGDSPQSNNESEATHARQEHGHSNAQKSCRGLQLESNASVRTVQGDGSGPGLYPGSQLYELIIGIQDSETGEEQQTHYDNVIKFIGASVVTSTGANPTSVVAILFGDKSRCQPPPMLVAGLTNKEREKFWKDALLRMENLKGSIRILMSMTDSP